MNMQSMSMPANTHNIKLMKEFAKSKDYILDETGIDSFDLIDNQNGETVCKAVTLMEIHDFLSNSDD